MSARSRSIDVYADWTGLTAATRLGALFVQQTRNKEVFSFEYDEAPYGRPSLQGARHRGLPELRQLYGRAYLVDAYDLNSSPDSTGLSLAIDEHDNSLNFELALSVAKFFRLTEKDAQSILDSVKATVVTRWRANLPFSPTKESPLSGAGFSFGDQAISARALGLVQSLVSAF